MRQILVMMAAAVLMGCSKDTPESSQAAEAAPQVASKPTPVSPADEKLITDPIVEEAIRIKLKKLTGELTKADLEKVTRLGLGFNQLTDVKGLEKLTQLTSLWIYNNQLTEVPKELEKLTQLTTLYLTDNQLTDVKGLENLTQLERLILFKNQLTDVKGLEKLTQLKELNLEDNQLTDVTGLEKLTQLEFLFIRNNPDLTKAQIAELQKALPKCKIISNPKK